MRPRLAEPRLSKFPIAVLSRGIGAIAAVGLLMLAPATAFAHPLAAGDKGFVMCNSGRMLVPFMYLGAKHMVTGYDHLLFLVAVIFFLYRVRDIGLYVTLFALGHSLTLLLGVLAEVHVSAYLIDAIIGFSVIYKAADNLGVFQKWFGVQPNTKLATLVFGLFHGMGLATRILDYNVDPDGLIPNLLGFNVGVEIGQLLSLGVILIAMSYWRRRASFTRYAYAANVGIILAGPALVANQAVGFIASRAG